MVTAIRASHTPRYERGDGSRVGRTEPAPEEPVVHISDAYLSLETS